MRFSSNLHSIHAGNVEIHEVSRVIELDAGNLTLSDTSVALDNETANSVPFSHEALHIIETQLAIIVPCMNEEHQILEGVLQGVPHECLIILVSNSNDSNFKGECRMLEQLCSETQRQGIVLHQKDRGIARSFDEAGMRDIVVGTNPRGETYDSELTIRNGKGEAMMIGTVIAKLAGKQFVGFIDADNFVPGAVHEYCKVFAAGLYQALHYHQTRGHYNEQKGTDTDPNRKPLTDGPHVMARIKWKSKPKIEDGKLVAKASGRCSRVVNEWMNRLANTITGEATGTELIQTANAGEHAMSIGLAFELCFATGYAVEPFQLVDAWERSRALSGKVQILQIETCNPHIHDFGKGEEHILRMQMQGLSTIYYSDLIPPKLREELRTYMKAELPSFIDADGVPTKARCYQPLRTMELGIFLRVVGAHARTMKVFGDVEGLTFAR